MTKLTFIPQHGYITKRDLAIINKATGNNFVFMPKCRKYQISIISRVIAIINLQQIYKQGLYKNYNVIIDNNGIITNYKMNWS